MNPNNKILTKSISLILAHAFLLTSVACPEAIVNKNISSIYIQAKSLRVPMGNYGRPQKVFTNTSSNAVKKTPNPRRDFLIELLGAAIAAASTLGTVIYNSKEPSDAKKQEHAYLKKPIHYERYDSKEQFEKEKNAFISARAGNNILGPEDIARVEGFLNQERIYAILFAADKWRLEPALLAGFLYEEKVHTASRNAIKEFIKEFLSRRAHSSDMKNTAGLGNVNAFFMQEKEFLDFLYNNRDFIMGRLLKTKDDKAIFEEFIAGTYHSKGYGYIKYMPENDGIWDAWLKTIYPVLNSLANKEPINILLAAYAMRVKAREISLRNKLEADIPATPIMKKNSGLWVVEQYKEIPETLRARYSGVFNSRYYPPYAYQYFLAVSYTGVRSMTERAIAKVNAYMMFSKSSVFKTSESARFYFYEKYQRRFLNRNKVNSAV